MQEQRLYSSTELQRATGCTRKAFRIYQQRGLIRPTVQAGTRRYDAATFGRLRFIVCMRELGLAIDRIEDILGLDKAETEPAGEEARRLASEVSDLIELVGERLRSFTSLREYLVEARETLFACSNCDQALAQCTHCADQGRLDSVSETLMVR